ncbi:MAG: hypothetical protein QNJ32_20630, partial [Xenococcaceae cyanobacterium MO_167.B27]|nr:hypothetical protein [Xenococcaceae cyanobacterium MO_167.B27]
WEGGLGGKEQLLIPTPPILVDLGGLNVTNNTSQTTSKIIRFKFLIITTISREFTLIYQIN